MFKRTFCLTILLLVLLVSSLILSNIISVQAISPQTSSLASPGTLDSTFGNNGRVLTDFGNTNDFGRAVAIQPDGKIIVAGTSSNNTSGGFALARYNGDGSLDLSFGNNGMVAKVMNEVNTVDAVDSMLLQPDGKIVVGGGSMTSGFVLVRYNNDGSWDTSFGNNGEVITNCDYMLPYYCDHAYSLALQSDGKIVAAGGSDASGLPDFELVRYNPDGSLDSSFDGDGKVTTDFGAGESGKSVVIQQDGRIVVAGIRGGRDGSPEDFVLARYNSDGSLDTTFDGDGKVISDFGSNELVSGAVLQADGKIVLAGTMYGSGHADFLLARYNSNGTLDTTFHGDGKVITDFGNNDDAAAITIQLNGKIIVAGASGSSSTDGGFAIARYNSDGSLDTTFDGDGKVITATNSDAVGASSIALQPDGKLVAAGVNYTDNLLKSDFAVVRLIGDPTTPTHLVKWNAPGANNGTSWANAYSDLQSALAAASSGDEIWVAAGTYKPTTGTDRTVSFILKNGVAIYGGFSGTETLRTQSNPATNITILSGDIGAVNDKNDNSYHVVVGSYTSNSAVLDGFTITGGNANGSSSPNNLGGGMYNLYGNPSLSNLMFNQNSAGNGGGGVFNQQSSPLLKNISFTNNASGIYGGGMYNTASSNANLTDVTFSANTSGGPGGGMYNGYSNPIMTNVSFSGNIAAGSGGGMNNSSSSPTLTNAVFSENSSNGGGGMKNDSSNPSLNHVSFLGNLSSTGGGMLNLYSSPILTDVRISGNSATTSGGGIYNGESSPTLTNVTISENSAVYYGGGMDNHNNSSPTLTNVTFYSNSSPQSGGGMMNVSNSNPTLTNVTFWGNSTNGGGSGIYNNTSNPALTNVILWDKVATGGSEVYNYSSTPLISYSIVRGGYSGTGNLDTDPLLGPLQDNGGFTQTMALLPGSPAIDTGSETTCAATDQRGVTRPQGSHCDMGAYEALDTFAPAVSSIVRASANPTNLSSVSFTVKFSEPVVNVGKNDFAITSPGISGALISNVTGTGDTYAVTVTTGSGNGTLLLGVAANVSIADLAGNPLGGLPFLGGEYYTIDKTPPETSINSQPTNPNNNVAANFSFSSSDLTAGFECRLDGAAFSTCTSPRTYSSLANGSHTFDVRAKDLAGNSDPTPSSYTWMIDTIVPTVESVVRASANPTNLSSVSFTVTFSEAVTGVDATDFALTKAGMNGTGITNVTGTGSNYTVSVQTGTGNGTIRLDVVDDDSIKDAAGNTLGASFTGGETYTILPATLAGCPMFPANNIWNTPVDTLPIHARSDQWVNSIGRSTGFHMDFGSGTWNGGPIGIPYNTVGSSTPKVNVSFYYPDESDAGPYPIPSNPLMEYGSDHHMLIVDNSNCTLYELYDASYSSGKWHAGSGAIWDLNSNALRPDTWTSADAAGLPILPGLVRYDEILAGQINHAIRFTAQNTNGYIWPARHLTSNNPSAAQIPPMGARFRLKASYNISSYPPEMQAILRAMKTYGIILADNGSNWYVSGAPDAHWNNTMLHLLDSLTGNDFEAVDTSGLIVDYNSGATSVTITGNVGIPGVTLSYTDGTAKTITSLADGSYSLQVTNGWSGTVTPSQACYNFAPSSRTYDSLTANQTAQNYIATFNGSSCAASTGTYDDTDSHWVYAGTWRGYSGTGPFNNTLHYTGTVKDVAWFPFKGTQFIFSYTQASNRGSFEVYVDGNKIATVNANGTTQWQKTFTSPVFLSGTHVAQFRNIGGKGPVFDVDAIDIRNTAAPGVATYDDSSFNWRYDGKWTSYSGSGPYNNTLHYTATSEDTASFTFTGTQFILSYTQNTNRGSFEVYVDGNKIDTVNAHGALQWQKMYVSPVYSSGAHEVQLKNIGGSGPVIDVDAIQVFNAPIPGSGPAYDDSDVNWLYSGTWSTFSGSGPANNTLHYTTKVGSTASFIFTGTQFTLSYTQNTNRGSFEVYVDGNKVATVNANGALQWQKTFTSPIFTTGTHVVQLKNIGGSATVMDVDAIQILATPLPGTGPYEDSDTHWFYSGKWSTFSGSGPSGNNLHYTSAVGNWAWFPFNGTQFILKYTQNTNRGSFDVYVDGSKITTINANGALQWQKTFTSPVFSTGTHVVQFKNIGGSGSITDVDAIQILP